MIGNFGSSFVLTAKLRAIETSLNFAGERMAHVLDLIDSAFGIPLLFKGKNRKQEIDIASNTTRAIRAPGPQLRTDVVDHFKAITMERARQSQIKLRPVNQNYRVGSIFASRLLQKFVGMPKLRDDPSDLKQTHDRKIV